MEAGAGQAEINEWIQQLDLLAPHSLCGAGCRDADSSDTRGSLLTLWPREVPVSPCLHAALMLQFHTISSTTSDQKDSGGRREVGGNRG